MELIFVARRGISGRALHLGPWAVTMLLLLLMAAAAGAFWLGGSFGAVTPTMRAASHDPRPDLLVASMVNQLATLREEVIVARDSAERDLDALAQQVAELQARAIRVDALGGRLVDMVGLSPEEFSFGSAPPMGGPEPLDSGLQTQASDLAATMDELATRLAGRVHELEVLEKSLLEARLAEQMHPRGRPVSIGWVSSGFGWRNDPVTGRRSFHEGIDFPGPPGSPIFSVASGIVTFSGVRSGFGNVVEIDILPRQGLPERGEAGVFSVEREPIAHRLRRCWYWWATKRNEPVAESYLTCWPSGGPSRRRSPGSAPNTRACRRTKPSALSRAVAPCENGAPYTRVIWSWRPSNMASG